MLQMRKNVFETNSSSTHSITMCTQNEYDRWMNGEVYLNEYWWRKDNESEYKDKKFVTRDEAINLIECNGGDIEYDKEYYDSFDEYIAKEYEIYTCDEYLNENDCLEWFEDKYTTDSGETVVAFGLYGYDY